MLKGALMEPLDIYQTVVAIAFPLVALARAIVRLTPSDKDDLIVAKVARMLDVFGGGDSR